MSESEDKLLLLKKKSLLSATVHKGIVVWLEANSAQKLLARQRFKIVFKHINLISKEFLTAWIEYVFLKKFSWAIKDQAEDSIMLLSEKLNSTYQQMTTGMNDLSFKLLVVYLVRVAAQFLESNADIEVDPTLESEICVIFYHTVIGIPVGTKTFAVLERQLVNPLSKFQIFGLLKQKQKSKECDSSKETSRAVPQSKKVIKQTARNKVVNRNSIAKKCRQSRVEQFGQTLKMNLYVDPLPPIVHKKVTIEQYDRENIGPLEKVQCNRINQRRSIFSNQLSLAMKLSYLQHSLQIQRGKKARLNCSRQMQGYSGFHLQRLESKSSTELLTAVVEENKEVSRKQNIEWKDIIDSLKKKAFHHKLQINENNNTAETLTKHQSLYCVELNGERSGQSTNFLQTVDSNIVSKDEPESFEKSTKQKQGESNFFIVHTFAPKKTEEIKKQSKRLASSLLRLDKKQFASLCQTRSIQLTQNNGYKQLQFVI